MVPVLQYWYSTVLSGNTVPKWQDLELESKINNFGSATMDFSCLSPLFSKNKISSVKISLFSRRKTHCN